jgi:Family of unknown function (DUF6364)
MNLTLSISDELVERAREVARQQGTSLNALVRKYLESLAGARRGEDVARQFDDLWRERSGHSGGWQFRREELYEERVGRGRPR